MTPGALILVIALEDLPIGYTFDRTRQSWPLHITLLNWFTTQDEPSTLDALAHSASLVEPFVVLVGDDAMFGSENDVPVSLLENDAELKALHKNVLKTVLDTGGELSQETVWIGDDYTPHATHHGSKRAKPGENVTVSRICIVTVHEGDKCEVARYIPLGRSSR